jgi:hypothetical protein
LEHARPEKLNNGRSAIAGRVEKVNVRPRMGTAPDGRFPQRGSSFRT